MVRYYPVCKWKKGEQEALKRLSPDKQLAIQPIVEIVEEVTPEEFLQTLAGINCPIYLDTDNIEEDEKEILISILRAARQTSKDVYAVLSYPFTLNDVLEKDLFCNCLVKVPLFLDEGESEPSIKTMISAFAKKGIEDYGIILDIGTTDKQAHLKILQQGILSFEENFQKFIKTSKALIICTSSFPESLAALQSGETRMYPRHDFKLFKQHMKSIDETLTEKIAYSDFGVSRFTDSEIDFSILKNPPLPKVKYTTEEMYYVVKGKRNSRTRQYILGPKDMAKKIVDSDFFYGKDYSYGDSEIYKKSLPDNKQGNNTNWVTYCANHHITVLIDQVSSLFDS